MENTRGSLTTAQLMINLVKVNLDRTLCRKYFSKLVNFLDQHFVYFTSGNNVEHHSQQSFISAIKARGSLVFQVTSYGLLKNYVMLPHVYIFLLLTVLPLDVWDILVAKQPILGRVAYCYLI